MSTTVRAQPIPLWTLEYGWAGELSLVDNNCADPRCAPTNDPEEEVTLIPYSCTNIRIAEFPRVK
ncbi:MAG: hypothetical protein U0164_16750 [Gemmatimonadaceae bacterium]